LAPRFDHGAGATSCDDGLDIGGDSPRLDGSGITWWKRLHSDRIRCQSGAQAAPCTQFTFQDPGHSW
ncbi:MAG: hypothetical protein ACK56I_32425, partial [bacterium]